MPGAVPGELAQLGVRDGIFQLVQLVVQEPDVPAVSRLEGRELRLQAVGRRRTFAERGLELDDARAQAVDIVLARLAGSNESTHLLMISNGRGARPAGTVAACYDSRR